MRWPSSTTSTDTRGLTWRDRRLDPADVQLPGDTAAIGRNRQRCLQHLPPEYTYDEVLPPDYWDPAARAERLVRWDSIRPCSSQISGSCGRSPFWSLSALTAKTWLLGTAGVRRWSSMARAVCIRLRT